MGRTFIQQTLYVTLAGLAAATLHADKPTSGALVPVS